VILRLHRAGLRVIATEIEQPTTVRRTVAFSEAIYCGEVEVEGLRARKLNDCNDIPQAWSEGVVPVLVDPWAEIVPRLRPAVVVDAIIAKRNLGTRITDAPVVIGLGPGFEVGVDVHAVVETNRGHHLGRVLWHGCAEPDTGPAKLQATERSVCCGLLPRVCFGEKERLEIGLRPARWLAGSTKLR
jgi:xanthine dehydrogenase accessory factor